MQRILDVIHGRGDGSQNPSNTEKTSDDQKPVEITIGPQANFTLLDQVSEMKKQNGELWIKKIFLFEIFVFIFFYSMFSVGSEQTSTEKLRAAEEKIFHDIVETKGLIFSWRVESCPNERSLMSRTKINH